MAEQKGSSQRSELNKSDLNENARSGEQLTEPKNIQDLTQYVEDLLHQLQEKFQVMSDQILARIDGMGHRIDDLEKNIADLMTQTGVDTGK
ncbi:heat shock factor-binding protein 1-like [Limulus polyphemus]|uniref:Heat shock factor-binding protein 1-like n=1 Tax=Limulus polyphemus TaxID=6850 RepID=A0ABM1SZD0_LIMPO|nr:heat shock factor-binding protein 1-like [Limulus polyphemus]XP_022248987.1 heat shock factor-binding protein 1-like [Limulus polyphemus]